MACFGRRSGGGYSDYLPAATRVGLGGMVGYVENRRVRGRGVGGLFGICLEEGDEICAVLLLLEPGEDHFGTLDVLLGVEQILEQGLIAPGNARVLVGSCVREAFYRPALTAKQAIEIRTLLRDAALLVCGRRRMSSVGRNRRNRCIGRH